MRLLLIRHAESVGNAQRAWGGITDHALTLTGVAQAEALGIALESLPLTHIFASPLQRARDTASAIRKHHPNVCWRVCDELKEQNLGSAEDRPFKEIGRAQMKGGETRQQMALRARAFLANDLFPIDPSSYVAIVSHGIFLDSLSSALKIPDRGFWSNTGYMEVEMDRNHRVVVKRVNASGHLEGIRKTRGLGSVAHDKNQKRIHEFFKPTNG